MPNTSQEYVVCETVAAISKHLRKVTSTPVNYSGFAEQPLTLCNKRAAWDTKLPIEYASCEFCLDKFRTP